MQKNKFFAFLLLTLSSLFWSGNFLTGKLAFNNDLSPFKLSFFRWLLAFLILFPFSIEIYIYCTSSLIAVLIFSLFGK